MEEKPQQVPSGLADNTPSGVSYASYAAPSAPKFNAQPGSVASLLAPPESPKPPEPAPPPKPHKKVDVKKLLKRGGLAGLIALLLIAVWLTIGNLTTPKDNQTLTSVTSRFDPVKIPLADLAHGDLTLIGTRSLTINGPMRVNDTFALSPSGQPSNATRGQIYYDGNDNFLAYYNGSEFVELAGGVQNIGGATGTVALGAGLATTGGAIANTGVLSVQGQTGAVNFTAGTGVAMDGTTILNTGVTSLGDTAGDIAIGNGLSITDGTLTNTGVASLTAGTLNLLITDDGAGNLTISDVGGGSGTVQSPGGTAGRIAKFTGAQTIADSLLSESGTVVTVNGDLAVTGSLTLGTPLSVSNGGTGVTSLTGNGVVVGAGSGALTAVATGTPGLCLVSTAGAPIWDNCTGSATVTSVNGLSGALTIANASAAGSTITIDDASTSQKGIAQFNNTNFTASGGTVNTIQDIHSSASPTFTNQTLTGDLAVNGGDITSTSALTIAATAAFTLQGNENSVINATDGVNTTTLSFQDPTADVNYRFATAAAGNYDICTTVGNCAATGGVTTAGGTNGRIAKFTGAQTIGDSLLSEAGVTVTVAGNLNLATGNQFQINGTQISSANLSNDSNLAKLNASQTFTGDALAFRNGTNSATAFSIQNAATNRVLTVDTLAGEAELGQGGTLDGRLVFNNATNANTITLVSSAASGNHTITLPDDSGTICLSTGNCAGAGATLQTAYNNSTSPEITLDSTRGALTIRDNVTPLGANLLEVQNNAGGTTYFAVSATGVSATGIANVTGNINSSGGALQTGGTTRIDNSGNASNIGNVSLSGSISGGTTYSGSGNVNSTGGSLQTNSTTRVDNSGNLVNIGNLTGTGALTIASSGAGNDVIIDGADRFVVQDAASFFSAEFAADVDLILADTENLGITNTVTGTNSVNLINTVLTNNTSSGTQQVAVLQNAAGSGSTENLLLLHNADTDTAVAGGIQITSAAGGITTAIDVSDPDIVTALLFGANDITGTNFSVTGSNGDITSAGNATLQGGTVTAGTASQIGSLVVHDGSSNTGTLQVAALGQDTVYTLPDAGGATATICLTTGNCAGTGGGITGSGTTNRLSKFTASGTIGDSSIADDGTTVTTTVDVVVQGGDLTVGGTSQLASLLLHDGNGQTTTLRAGDSSGDLTFVLPTTAGNANQCLKQSGTGNQLVWQDCDGGGGGSSGTLQTAYGNGNSITTTDGRDIDIVLANTTTDSNFDLVVADGSTGFVSFTRADGAGTTDPAQMLLVDNLDTNRALPIGIKLQAAGGGITTAIDASDAEIVDAISVGANNIIGTTGNIDMSNFDVVGASGDITTAGDLAVNGGNVSSTGALIITASGGNLALTSGGTIELQDDTNVTGNTDVSGTLTAGTADAFQVAASGDITTAGDATIQGGLLTVGTSSQGGTVVLYDGSTHTGSIVTTALSDNRTYTLPDESGTICLSTGNCAGAGVTLQSAYNNSTTPEITVDGTRGAVTIRDNAVAIGANLLEVQNNAGSTTYFGVNASGVAVTGTVAVSGNINSSGGSLQTGGTNRVDNTGNLVNIGNITGTGAIIIASSSAGNDVTIDGADQFIVQDVAVFNALTTFNSDVDLALADTENLSIASTVTGTNSVDLISATLTNNTSSGTQNGAVIRNAAGSGSTEALLVLDNADTDTSVAVGLQVTSGTGGVTTAIDLSDSDIVDAISVGANNIVGTTGNIDLTNFDVVGSSGNLTMAGVLQLGSLGATDTSTALCRNTLNQIAACSGTGSGAAWVQGGNSFGATGVIGTNDANGINIRVNTTTVATFGTNGSLNLQNSTNSAAALNVEDSSGNNLLTVDTTTRGVSGGNLVKIGDSTGTDGALTMLQLDAATADPASNLAALNGSLFYNSTTNKVSLIENGQVKIICNTTDLGCGTGTVTLQNAYNNSTNPEITVDSTRGALTVRDNAVAIGANLFEVQNNAGSTSYLAVAATGTTITGGLVQSGGNFSSTSTANASLTANGTITITAGGGSTWSTSSGSLTVRAAGTDSLILNTGGAGTVALGDQNTTTINIGRGSNIARTINIGNGGSTQAQAITLGSTGGSSGTTIQGGTGASAINLTAGTNGSINVTATGTGNINLNTASSIVGKSTTNNANAFRVLDASNAEMLGVDTDNQIVRLFKEANVRGTGTDSLDGVLTFGTSAAWTPTIRGVDESAVTWGFNENVLSLEAAGFQIGTGSGNPAYTIDGFNGRHVLRMQTDFGHLKFLDQAGTTIFGINDISDGDGEATFRGLAASTIAFRVLNSSTVPMFQIDTTSDRIYIGNPTADSTGALLVLDTKDTAGDPTGVAGGMYYNSSMGIMRCYWDGQWRPCSAPTSPRWSYKIEEDFLNNATNTGVVGSYAWSDSNSGTTGANYSTVAADAANRPGQIQLSTGTSTTGWSSIIMSGTDGGGGGSDAEQIVLAGGEEIEFAINLANLSDGTNEYDARFGLCDEDDTDCVDGLYFEYDRNSSVNWRFASANNSTRTKTSSSTAVTTGWHWFRIVVNSSATSVEYFVDGASVGTISTNIPTTTARRTGPLFQIVKSAGGTARTYKIDYFYMFRGLGSGR